MLLATHLVNCTFHQKSTEEPSELSCQRCITVDTFHGDRYVARTAKTIFGIVVFTLSIRNVIITGFPLEWAVGVGLLVSNS